MADSKQENQDKKSRRYLLNIFEELYGSRLVSLPFTPTGAVLTLVTLLVIIAGAIFSLIAFTPVREMIPGYPSAEFRSQAIQNAARLDSLEEVTALYSIQLLNIQRIVSGRKPFDIDSLYTNAGTDSEMVSQERKAAMEHDDSLLRAEVTSQEMFAVSSAGTRVRQIEGILFFPPVKGVVAEAFDNSVRHPYIDISVPDNTTVNSALDGTVVSSEWSDNTGYTLFVQHDNNIITVYKNNARLLKKTGDKVKAGTAIAVAGTAGRAGAKSHLHFELWYRGEAIDPALYIKF